MTPPKIVTIRTAGGVMAQGELIGEVYAGRATINLNGQIVTGWHVPPMRKGDKDETKTN